MLAFDSAAEMSPQVMRCLMFPVSTAHRAVQNAHTGCVNIAETGETEPKVKRQDHPNRVQFPDGLTGKQAVENPAKLAEWSLHHSSVRWRFSSTVSH